MCGKTGYLCSTFRQRASSAVRNAVMLCTVTLVRVYGHEWNIRGDIDCSNRRKNGKEGVCQACHVDGRG